MAAVQIYFMKMFCMLCLNCNGDKPYEISQLNVLITLEQMTKTVILEQTIKMDV